MRRRRKAILCSVCLLIAGSSIHCSEGRRGLPEVKPGFTAEEVVTFGVSPVASDVAFVNNRSAPTRVVCNRQTGRLYVTTFNGEIYEVDPEKKSKTLYFSIHPTVVASSDVVCAGAAVQPRTNELFVSFWSLQENAGHVIKVIDSTRYETILKFDGKDVKALHALDALAFDPAGEYLYINNGAHENYDDSEMMVPGSKDTALSSAILRARPDGGPLPNATALPIGHVQVYARGIRNAFGMAFRRDGKLFIEDSGPDAHVEDELNLVVEHGHYGWPYRFGFDVDPNKTVIHLITGKPFTPPVLPKGLQPLDPIMTFTPHSSPAGMRFYEGGTLGAEYTDNLFVTRFGNNAQACEDGNGSHAHHADKAGFDVLRIELEDSGTGASEARSEPFVWELRRPIDLAFDKEGNLYVLEYSSEKYPGDKATEQGGRLVKVSKVSADR
jgi:glucose/arabinose dehydrogenase